MTKIIQENEYMELDEAHRVHCYHNHPSTPCLILLTLRWPPFNLSILELEVYKDLCFTKHLLYLFKEFVFFSP